ncbi:hypothetical protein [Streptomyces sp. NPDC090445]|uniref:hypothetical protein n=1 Tax=Streptomyces sp. NPDC090445 TaxID=3365963 RepID=UPI00381F0FE0
MKKIRRLTATLTAAAAVIALGAGSARADNDSLLSPVTDLLSGVSLVCLPIQQQNGNGNTAAGNLHCTQSAQQTQTQNPPAPGTTGFTDYEVVIETMNVLAGDSFVFDVECPAGKQVTGGGYRAVSGVTITQSTPYPGPVHDRWRIVGQNANANSVSVEGRAVCADVDD